MESLTLHNIRELVVLLHVATGCVSELHLLFAHVVDPPAFPQKKKLSLSPLPFFHDNKNKSSLHSFLFSLSLCVCRTKPLSVLTLLKAWSLALLNMLIRAPCSVSLSPTTTTSTPPWQGGEGDLGHLRRGLVGFILWLCERRRRGAGRNPIDQACPIWWTHQRYSQRGVAQPVGPLHSWAHLTKARRSHGPPPGIGR